MQHWYNTDEVNHTTGKYKNKHILNEQISYVKKKIINLTKTRPTDVFTKVATITFCLRIKKAKFLFDYSCGYSYQVD